MAFSDNNKLELLKEMMIKAVKQGSTWDSLKAEFAALSTAFKDETRFFLDKDTDKVDTEKDKWSTHKDNMDSLVVEIGEL